MEKKKLVQETINWTCMVSEQTSYYIAGYDDHIIYIGSPNAVFEEMTSWVNKHFPQAVFAEAREKFSLCETELQQSLAGERTIFSFAAQYYGTAFQQSVWQQLCKIPYGLTVTYSDIAKALERPSAVRAVAAAIGANPLLVVVPCHRVIGKDGTLTGYRGGLAMKETLLRLEKR